MHMLTVASASKIALSIASVEYTTDRLCEQICGTYTNSYLLQLTDLFFRLETSTFSLPRSVSYMMRTRDYVVQYLNVQRVMK